MEPIKGLKLKANLGIDRKYQKRKTYLPKTTQYGAAVNGQAYLAQEDNNDYLMDLTANYQKIFGEHSFNVLFGYSYQKFNTEGMSAGIKILSMIHSCTIIWEQETIVDRR